MRVLGQRQSRDAPPDGGDGQRGLASAAAILRVGAQGLFCLDADGNILPPVSRAVEALFPGRDAAAPKFDALLKQFVAEKSLQALRASLTAALSSGDAREDHGATATQDVEIRLPSREGSTQVAHYGFEIAGVAGADDRTACIVCVTDRTLAVQHGRELEDLRTRVQTQTEILRSVLQAGRARFAASLQRTDAAMTAINAILKKPAREQAAFRNKLEETLAEVDRIRREGAALKLSSLENAARLFEDSLHELRGRSTLSGSDFLPLAVKLDELFGQFVQLRLLMKTAKPAVDAANQSGERVTQNGTQILDAPGFIAMMHQSAPHRGEPRALESVVGASRAAVPPRTPSGGLENTLSALTEHIADEHAKAVALDCRGLERVPPAYLATVKNIAIQLIRNAVMHGVETPAERATTRKPPSATLRLSFEVLADASFELRFRDDGRGVDPQVVMQTAVARQLITPEAAALLNERQAIKLIFKAGYTTLPLMPGGPPHGAGLSVVRRYVHDAGGKIAVASSMGRETRFKINLPAVAPA